MKNAIKIIVFILLASFQGFSRDHEDCDKGPEYQSNSSNPESPVPTLALLPNFQIYALLDSLKPGEVVVSLTTETGLNATNEFNNFFVACHQPGRYQDAFYFVRQKDMAEAEKALSIYGRTNPSFYAYLVPLNDNNKFWELAKKTSKGCANKDGSWDSDVEWRNTSWEKLYNEKYCLLDKDKIKNAKEAPSQWRSWSCGPNSGFRALRLLNETRYDYDSFVENCPRRISKETTISNGDTVAGVGVGLTVAGMILAPFTLGLSIIPGVVTFVAGGATSVTGANISSDVGPTPEMLGEYLTKCMKAHKARFSGYSSQTDYEKSITSDVRLGYPRIVLIVSGTFDMHYVNIIGIKPTSNGYFTEAVLLNTNGSIGVISDMKLEQWLNRDGVAWLILDAKYNTIEFF